MLIEWLLRLGELFLYKGNERHYEFKAHWFFMFLELFEGVAEVVGCITEFRDGRVRVFAFEVFLLADSKDR